MEEKNSGCILHKLRTFFYSFFLPRSSIASELGSIYCLLSQSFKGSFESAFFNPLLKSARQTLVNWVDCMPNLEMGAVGRYTYGDGNAEVFQSFYNFYTVVALTTITIAMKV